MPNKRWSCTSQWWNNITFFRQSKMKWSFWRKQKTKQNNDKQKGNQNRSIKKAKVRRTARNISIILFLCSQILPHSQPPSPGLSTNFLLFSLLSVQPSTGLTQSRQPGARQTEEAQKFGGLRNMGSKGTEKRLSLKTVSTYGDTQ